MGELSLTYEEFRADYEKRHPASVPRRARRRYEYPLWVMGGVLLMYISSAGLSGVHTAPTVYKVIEAQYVSEFVRQMVSVGSFAAVELAIPLSAFMNKARLARWVLRASFTIAVTANVTSTLTAQASHDLGAILVSLVFGVGAPLIALMSGEMLVQITASRRATAISVDEEHLEAQRRFDAVVNGEWSKYQKLSVRVLSDKTHTDRQHLVSGDVLSEQTDIGQTSRMSRSGFGFNRSSDATEKALAWFDANPMRVNEATRKIAVEIGIGHDTVAKARRQWWAAQRNLADAENPDTNGEG